MAKVIDGLYYSESHEFVKVDGEYAYIGITDYAQEQLGNVTYVELPEIGDEITKDEDFGSVESVKAASDLTAPLSGEIVEVNEQLDEEPELINKAPFENWIVKISIKDKKELDELLNSEDYRKICN